MSERQPLTNAPPAVPEVPLARTAIWYAFFAVLFNFGYSGLMHPATDFLLKDRFHLGPEAMAKYGAIVALPGYAGFLYGYARDRWAPRLGGDRGVILVGHLTLTLAFGTLAVLGTTYARLIALTLIVSAVSSFAVAGLNGGLVSYGKRYGVADRLSGFLMVVGTATISLAGVSAGFAAAHWSFGTILFAMAALNLAVCGWLFLAPKGTFSPPEPLPKSPSARPIPLISDFLRLAKSRAYVLAVAIGTVRGIGFVSSTVIFYELTVRLKVGPEMLGGSGALGGIMTVTVGLLYGRYARRTTLRRALLLGTLLGVPGPFLIFLVQRPSDLLPLAAWGGATAAIFAAPLGELLLRSMPSESAGLGYAVNSTLGNLGAQVSNLIGAWIYAHYGVAACVWLSLPFTLLLVGLAALVPNGLAGRQSEEEAPSPEGSGEGAH